VLLFQEIVKGGFIWGGQVGEGALMSHGHTLGYYKTIAASYGLQAGIQKFGYALFFMHNGDLDYLRKSRGWEIGSGPSVLSSIQEWPSRSPRRRSAKEFTRSYLVKEA
jgi:lipid-binding SYLF domain-containing protein